MTKGIIDKLSQKNAFLIIIVALIIIRIFIGFNLHYWLYSNAALDDGWMMSASDIPQHHLISDEKSLIKNMMYPLFLFLNGMSGLPYNFSLTLLWLTVAVMGLFLAKKFTSNRIVWMAVFAFLLFFPSAFETDVGTKVYRNSIIVPLIFMLIFALLQLAWAIVIDKYRNKKAVFGWSVVLGLSLFVNFYIKENGLWQLLLVCGVLVTLGLYIVYRETRKARKISPKALRTLAILAFALLLPIIIFNIGTFEYKKINQRHYGVFEINTRTEGEYGKFVDNIYKVKANGRSDVVWAPWDAIKKVFAVSPTLRSSPKLEDNIYKSHWVSTDGKTPKLINNGVINGDFMTWVLRDAYIKSNKGKWNEAKAESFFAKANKEIAVAFDDGRLEKAGRVQITSSMGGYTLPQMVGLSDIVAAGLRSDMFFHGYKYEGSAGDCADQTTCDQASKQLNMDFNNNGGKAHITRMANTIIHTYQILNPIAVLLALIGIITEIVFIIRRKASEKSTFTAVSAVILCVGGVAVVFAIAWFVNFIHFGRTGHRSPILYYAVEATPLLITAEFLGLYLFFGRARTFLRKPYKLTTAK